MRVRFAFLRPGKIAKTLTGLVRDILDELQPGSKTQQRELKDEVQRDPPADPPAQAEDKRARGHELPVGDHHSGK